MTNRRARWARRASVAALVPAALFVAANILKYQLGLPALYDAIFGHVYGISELREVVVNAAVVGGPPLAVALAVLSSVRFDIHMDGGAVTGHIDLKIERTAQLVIAAALVLTGIIGAYLVAENLPCLTGAQRVC